MFLNELAKKWQQQWDNKQAFKTITDLTKPKMYCLDMYPYPSGVIHIGHLRNYSIGDSLARFYRMKGKNVLYPMGFDAFGLPAENAAIQSGIAPEQYTEKNMDSIRQQLQSVGFSFDWSREVASLRPDYYQWNQWIFLQFFKKGLAYRKKAVVNWCLSCTTVLANEQVEDGKCWRCDSVVEEKSLQQWFFKITDYAEQLLNDIDLLEDWPNRVKVMQKNWIGKSKGVEIDFPVEGKELILPCFTTRADTLFSVTFLVIAPEHPLVQTLTEGVAEQQHIQETINQIKNQTTIERTTPEGKDKFGVFTGQYAINPVTKKKIPIYVANFVLMEHGTGIVMADAHDTRDFAFARKYNIDLAFVISKDGKSVDAMQANEAHVDDGILFNSAQFSGMHNREALPKIEQWLVEQHMAKQVTHYKLRDWLISRQRYWGTPIPILYCDTCGVVPVDEKQLPVLLPKDINFSGKENPLTTSSQFATATCPTCKNVAKRETDTMDTFVDSSWYFLRFCSPDESSLPFRKQDANYWMSVDQYTGGIEHAVLHLLYARFFTKALRDLGLHDISEPFKRLLCQGMVLNKGAKMSKSKGNAVSFSEIMDEYGADTTRVFSLFASLPEKDFEWSNEGIAGVFRFLKRIWTFLEEKKAICTQSASSPNSSSSSSDGLLLSKVHFTIQEVEADIEKRRLNMAISSLMNLFSSLQKHTGSAVVLKESLSIFSQLLSPFAPHLAEEIWEQLGNKGFVSLSSWPVADTSKIYKEYFSAEQFIDTICHDISSVLSLAQVTQPKKLIIYVSSIWKYAFFNSLKTQLEKTRDFKEVLDAVMVKEHSKEVVAYVKKALQHNVFSQDTILSQEKELALLQEYSEQLLVVFEQAHSTLQTSDIVILPAEDAEEIHTQKANQAIPGKPAILLL